MRYNISTDDYAPYSTDSTKNLNDGIEGIASPIEDNPYVDVGGRSALRLNINTDKTGRIFQERSHVFKLLSRPAEIKSDKIFNVNVRGKRGNIVQVYPAVEFPTTCRCLQQTLYIYNGLGQTPTTMVGAAEMGKKEMKVKVKEVGCKPVIFDNNEYNGYEEFLLSGTDRSNIVQIADLNDNFPMPFERSNMWNNANIRWIYHGKTDVSAENLAVTVASAGYYRCVKKSDCPEAEHNNYIVETKTKMNNLLNNAPASFQGAILRFQRGTYHYMSTRNNNFSNRSQKSTITVV